MRTQATKLLDKVPSALGESTSLTRADVYVDVFERITVEMTDVWVLYLLKILLC